MYRAWPAMASRAGACSAERWLFSPLSDLPSTLAVQRVSGWVLGGLMGAWVASLRELRDA
jgi:hypothetical protein